MQVERFTEIKLAYNINSPFKSYNYLAFIGGALSSDKKETYLGEYMSNHILLLSNKLFDINCDDIVDFRNKKVFYHNCLNKNIKDKIEIKSEILKKIYNGYYVSATVDEFYIPNRSAYKRERAYHDILIYGFNLEKNVFYTCGYDITEKFTSMDYDIDLIISSIEICLQERHTKPHFHFFKPNYRKSHFDLEKVKDSFTKYICCQPIKNRVYDGYYGLSAYDNLINIIKMSDINNKTLRWATFSMLYEHKKLMLQRFEYMRNIGIFLNDSILEEYKEVVKIARIIEMMYVKYTLTGEGIKKIEDKIKVIRHLENEIFTELIKII